MFLMAIRAACQVVKVEFVAGLHQHLWWAPRVYELMVEK